MTLRPVVPPPPADAGTTRPDGDVDAARRGYVFISFKTEEREVARLVKEALASRGYGVWWQEEIQCGQEWHGALDSALANAGCVVVLWSPRSMLSPWVKHEASQAMARNVYAPVRIAPMEVPPPFNRLQATDLMGWDGKAHHPGFERLLALVERLLPEPVPVWRRAWNVLSRNWVAVLAVLIASAALAALAVLGTIMASQVKEMREVVEQQKKIAHDVERSLHPIESFEAWAWVRVDLSLPELRPYRDRLVRELGQLRPSDYRTASVSLDEVDVDGRPIVFTMGSDSPLRPVPDREQQAFYLLRYVDLTLSAILDPSAPGSSPAPDFKVGIGFSEEKDIQMEWNMEEQSMRVGLEAKVNAGSWTTNRRILSIPDLMEAQIQVRFNDIAVLSSGGRVERQALQRARAALRLETLELRISGLNYMFGKAQLQERTGPDGLRYYVTRLGDAEP